MRKYLPVFSLFVLFACQDKVICPAFQSTYILDDSVRNAYYSYVWQLDEVTRTQFLTGNQNAEGNDSLGVVAQPKTDYYAYAGEKVVPWRVRKRTKYGIVKYEPYWLKKYRMRTAPMENVYSPKPVENNLVATDFTDSLTVDSLGIDSLAIASLDSIEVQPIASTEAEEGPRYLYKYNPSDNFNVEQEYYNKYFGKRLVDSRPKPKPPSAITQPADSLANAVPDSLQRKGSPFRGLFKKKKNKADTTSTTPTPEIEDTGND